MPFAYNTSFKNLRGKEIAADVVKASAMEERSHNGLNEPQDSTMNNKLLSSTTDDIDTVTNYVSSSTNPEWQTHCEHLNTIVLYCIYGIMCSSNPYKVHTYRILNLSYTEIVT
jgi:hypothetical protein